MKIPADLGQRIGFYFTNNFREKPYDNTFRPRTENRVLLFFYFLLIARSAQTDILDLDCTI